MKFSRKPDVTIEDRAVIGLTAIGGISESLTILNQPNISQGYISQYLNSKANCLVENIPIPDKPITVLADEILPYTGHS